MRELSPRLMRLPAASLACCHHSSKEKSVSCGAMFCSPTCLKKWNQNCRANTQETSRWLIVSAS
uniref:Uncharacterized protein n=1 Tax=Arundo donax TaxID=35708 RepID=A0A0A9BEM4_ARUDO